LPGTDLICCIPDQRRFRFLSIDLYDFGAHQHSLSNLL
jgi:hypothetical protein